jgi:hypothetical protein
LLDLAQPTSDDNYYKGQLLHKTEAMFHELERRSLPFGFTVWCYQMLERSGNSRNVLLVDRCRDKLKAVEPDACLHIVSVGPERVEGVVRAGTDIGVVAEEATTEAIARVNG